jgi:hypothetical protein
MVQRKKDEMRRDGREKETKIKKNSLNKETNREM